MKNLYIIGAGGFGREVAWLVERINSVRKTWNLCGFIDDNPFIINKKIDGYKVVGNVDDLDRKNAWAVCAVGNAEVRKSIIDRLSSVRYATLIDPDAKLSKRVSVGEGSIVCAGNIITVDVAIGKHNIINLGCTIGHDAVFSDFVTLYPGVNISGQVKLNECVEMGTGSQVVQKVWICTGSIIGAGGVVVKDIEKAGTYVGIPVRQKS